MPSSSSFSRSPSARRGDRALASSAPSRRAALACLERLAADDVRRACRQASPFGAFQAIARLLRQEDRTTDKVWVVDAESPSHARDSSGGDPDPHAVSAWPLWLRGDPEQLSRPLLYLLSSESVAGLRSAMLESAGRGIFLNAAETRTSRWPKSVQPTVPIWLSDSADSIPYDPASGLETLAIVREAIQALYVEGRAGCVYLSLHDEAPSASSIPAAPHEPGTHVRRGMYRLSAADAEGQAQVRLLGAGRALGQVIRAAELLRGDWQIDTEVWSCPSYTGLARDGHGVERWNLLHPRSRKRVSHVQACLGKDCAPVLAVTGYGRHVANQIGGLVPARFVAIGSDAVPGRAGVPSAIWVVVAALKALADEGSVPLQWVERALQRYALRG